MLNLHKIGVNVILSVAESVANLEFRNLLLMFSFTETSQLVQINNDKLQLKVKNHLHIPKNELYIENSAYNQKSWANQRCHHNGPIQYWPR